jgi:hypothetical protein
MARGVSMAPDLLHALASALRNTAELEGTFDSLSIGIAIAVEPECRQIRLNATFADFLGLAPNRTLSPDDPAEARPFVLLKNGEPVRRDELPL